MYYWVRAEYGGKTYLVIPKGTDALTEADALRWAFERFPCSVEVIPLPTRSTSRASQLLKGRTLDEESDFPKSVQRLSHKI